VTEIRNVESISYPTILFCVCMFPFSPGVLLFVFPYTYSPYLGYSDALVDHFTTIFLSISLALPLSLSLSSILSHISSPVINSFLSFLSFNKHSHLKYGMFEHISLLSFSCLFRCACCFRSMRPHSLYPHDPLLLSLTHSLPIFPPLLP
jgi:hypothetical protein